MMLNVTQTFEMKRSYRVFIIAISLMVTAGCSEGMPPDGEIETKLMPTVHEQNEAQILVSNVSDWGMDALLTGTLARNEQGCLGAEYGDNEDFTLVIFPIGTTLIDTENVELPDGALVRIGEELQLGGGFIQEDSTAQELCGSTAGIFLSAPVGT